MSWAELFEIYRTLDCTKSAFYHYHLPRYWIGPLPAISTLLRNFAIQEQKHAQAARASRTVRIVELSAAQIREAFNPNRRRKGVVRV